MKSLNCVFICFFTLLLFLCVDARNNMCESKYPPNNPILLTSSWTSPKLTKQLQLFTNSHSPLEYLVFYNGSYPHSVRHQILSNFAASNQITDFTVQKKHRVFDTLPSDFDVLKVRESTAEIAFKKCSFVREISRQMKVVRSLNSKEDPHDPGKNKRLFKRNLARTYLVTFKCE